MSLLSKLSNKLKSDKRSYWWLREIYALGYLSFSHTKDKPCKPTKKRILFYNVNSLNFGGTEKFLQILAKHINKREFEVYFMYPEITEKNTNTLVRYEYVKSGAVIMLPFTYKEIELFQPYFVKGANPDITKLVKTLNIDVLVTTSSGSAGYPHTSIRKTPIVFLNIFGQPNLQKNIATHVCISKEVAEKISPIVPQGKIDFLPVPSEGPDENADQRGKELRKKIGIQEDALVFGRIGRSDNGIYDPIALNAFREALKTRTDIHYLVMSAPPKMIETVETEKIPNVHFLPPSSDEENIWAFHSAIDVLAHSRLDGESFGLNIAESMLSGNPIISHRSHIWNAHLEYLDESFARVSDKDDVSAYTKYILEFAKLHDEGKLRELGQSAQKVAEEKFLIRNNIGHFEELLKKVS